MTDTVPAHTLPAQTAPAHTAPHKFRFWLAFTCLIVAALFGALGIGAIAAGYGLAEEAAGAESPLTTIITFKIVGTLMFAMAVACLWLTYRLRPLMAHEAE
ncbi:MAG: hypothetical protein EP335_15455 [Alphaproteobacteria bacterium]|nr:MAG: hypothetical protein EP335_15455 [Alphaproteobacteria bacterium]